MGGITATGILSLTPTPLLGHEHGKETLIQLLQRPEGRLSTLTGPGSVGKTRLAMQRASMTGPWHLWRRA